MLEPRETDIPALLLVFVVFPLVIYILLGKCSESAKKRERISVLAQRAAEEALKVEVMAAASVIPLVPVPNSHLHQCARCFGPATTRCAQCKSVWYCSGKCQILSWREVHKHECMQMNNTFSYNSPRPVSYDEVHKSVTFDGKMDPQGNYCVNQPIHKNITSENIIQPPLALQPPGSAESKKVDSSEIPLMERKSVEKRSSRKNVKNRSNKGDGPSSECSDEVFADSGSCNKPPKEVALRNKENESISSLPECDASFPCGIEGNDGASSFCTRMESIAEEDLHRKEPILNDELDSVYAATERATMKRSNKAEIASHLPGSNSHNSPKLSARELKEQSCSESDWKGVTENESKSTRTKDASPSQGRDSVSSMGIMKMIGMIKPSKLERREGKEVNENRHRKLKMLFPYEEFVKLFQSELFCMSPRGLMNCGNSCYANAVLQCLSCTKPLAVFLSQRSHSRSCCVKSWCLMCELERHILMLRESGGPLSPSRIISHIRSNNCQIGDGSQEDAHEFLRLLIASMQSICLESLGGENVVDPRLQETTFIQHAFGGRLISKVKCLKCHHESERSENIMDLTLEIFGWVESLEDALTQFTSPEDLDGENMYRCSRCATYVRARKKLSIQETPNVLTIVLKRFREGSYGKINKCISFPEMLDMVPYMTGTDDVPPLYMLYAVVVHLDTLNASFSGHYIAYIKDLRGNWFRIDDTEVQPVEMNQVMSEGAYILFYTRSTPRPSRVSKRKTSCQQSPGVPKHCQTRTSKTSRLNPSRSNHHLADTYLPLDPDTYSSSGINKSTNDHRLPISDSYACPINTDFSDASSDWSLFTSSDDASFTTESTRDSISTVDYTDAGSVDPISSIFNSIYASNYPHKAIACSMFSRSKPQTKYVPEVQGSVLECYMPSSSKGKTSRQFSGASAEASNATSDVHVTYGRYPEPPHTYVNF